LLEEDKLKSSAAKGDPGAFYPSFVVGARLASPHGTLKDSSQSSYVISTKNGIRHKKNAGTRKALASEKVLTPEKCWHQKGSGATPLLTLLVLHLG
jgi:hypothetical protein